MDRPAGTSARRPSSEVVSMSSTNWTTLSPSLPPLVRLFPPGSFRRYSIYESFSSRLVFKFNSTFSCFSVEAAPAVGTRARQCVWQAQCWYLILGLVPCFSFAVILFFFQKPCLWWWHHVCLNTKDWFKVAGPIIRNLFLILLYACMYRCVYTYIMWCTCAHI